MKAFDKVPHRRLIHMMEYYGINDPVLNWTRAFLSDRRQRVVVNGESSEWRDVLSGIPQGSVLGPILFVIYINNLPEVVEGCEVYLFADDTKVFRSIFREEDCETLQTDIDHMFNWTEKSLLKFHPDKCGVMRIGKTKLADRSYTMGLDKHKLKAISEEKDIGVIIDDKLTFEKHMSAKINKANSIMGIIRRTYAYLDEESFLLLYKALVRPHMEYANQVWSPHLKKHISAIENVQRRATKLIPGFRDIPYQDRLKRLKLPTLGYRRIRGDMIELFKIMTGKYDTNVTDFINANRTDTRGHQYKIYKVHTRLDIRKYSFVHRNVNCWNNLPTKVVEAPSVSAFERRLDKLWLDEPAKYDWEAKINITRQGMRTAQRQDDDADLMPEAPRGLLSEEDL
jgi:hypothetical protein